jgi:hypothetical protein
MAAFAAAGPTKVTNPNPRDLPVSRSVLILTSTTGPNRSIAFLRLTSVKGLADNAQHVIFARLNPHFLTSMASFDVARNIYQAHRLPRDRNAF